MSARRVLVVEDSDLARTLLSRTLSRAGFEVLEAKNGVEAALIALRELPHAVVTDLEMPTMDGYQLVRLLRSDAVARQIPVIVLTSHTETSFRFWALRTGAEGFLTKDRPEAVAAEVERLALPADVRLSASGTPPEGPLDILTQVASQLDASLFEATVVNSLLERGIACVDLRSSCTAALSLLGEIVDTPLSAIGIADSRETVLHVQARAAVAQEVVEQFERLALTSLGDVVPGDALVTVETAPGEVSSAPDLAGCVILEMPVRVARAVLMLVPSDRDVYEATSRRIVEAMVNHLTLVIDNARLAERLRELSSRDALTGLHNRRAILEVIEAEMDRARRYRQELAIAICDLDHFKQVNDRHGHLAGDQALRVAAGALQDTLRTTDSVGRYGGEEFLAVLPHATLDAARTTAERLRHAIESRVVEPAGGAALHVTASFGVATFAELPSGAAADDLIALADQRLYEAKAAGRNRVRP